MFLDGTYVKRNWGGAYESVAVLVAVGVNSDGFREVIGVSEGYKESEDSWREFLLGLRGRGLSGVRMVTGDKSAGMLGALAQVFPEAMYQRCTVHFYRDVLAKVPKRRRRQVAAQLKAIHAQEVPSAGRCGRVPHNRCVEIRPRQEPLTARAEDGRVFLLRCRVDNRIIAFALVTSAHSARKHTS